jgi:hypothetical protein
VLRNTFHAEIRRSIRPRDECVDYDFFLLRREAAAIECCAT